VSSRVLVRVGGNWGRPASGSVWSVGWWHSTRHTSKGGLSAEALLVITRRRRAVTQGKAGRCESTTDRDWSVGLLTVRRASTHHRKNLWRAARRECPTHTRMIRTSSTPHQGTAMLRSCGEVSLPHCTGGRAAVDAVEASRSHQTWEIDQAAIVRNAEDKRLVGSWGCIDGDSSSLLLGA
jgi:hypothetical protein